MKLFGSERIGEGFRRRTNDLEKKNKVLRFEGGVADKFGV